MNTKLYISAASIALLLSSSVALSKQIYDENTIYVEAITHANTFT